jgi:hypothetical protein
MITCKTAEVHGDNMISSFSLAVGLRMEGRRHVQLGAQQAHQLLPECRDEHGSRSDTMDWGTPWRRTMFVKNACATDSAEYGWVSGMKWQYLLKRFTTVRMTDLSRTRGSASTKSMPMSAQTAVGMGSGRRRPVGCRCSDLYLWHVAHACTKSLDDVAHVGEVKVSAEAM